MISLRRLLGLKNIRNLKFIYFITLCAVTVFVTLVMWTLWSAPEATEGRGLKESIKKSGKDKKVAPSKLLTKNGKCFSLVLFLY